MSTVSDLTVQVFIAGVWTTVPAYSDDGWTTQMGPSVQSDTQASLLSVTLASDSYQMDPTNPAGPNFGKIGRNTQIRLKQAGLTIAAGEASLWSPDTTQNHVPGVRGKSWVDVTAAGVLERLGRWTDPLQSPMTRQTLSYAGLLGFWPIEDPSSAANLTQAASVAAPNGSYGGTVTLAGSDGAGGSDNLATIGSDGVLQGSFVAAPGDGYQIVWAGKLAALPPSAAYDWILAWVDADGRTWRWQANNTTFQWTVTAADGSLVSQTNTGFGTKGPDNWLRYRMKVTVSGGVVTYEPAWYVQDDPAPGGITNTFAATTAARPKTWIIPGNPTTTSGAFGQVFATTDTTIDFLTGDPAKAFNGYLGETAFQRYYRLLTEVGNLLRVWSGDINLTRAMGRQRPGLFLDLIQECVTTDGGILYDGPGGVAMVFRFLNDMVGQTVKIALNRTDLSPNYRKVIDAAPGGYNDLTGQNWDGTKYRAELTTGTMSTQPPPAGIGRYKGTINLSLQDFGRFVDRTNFELAKTSIDRPRYPTLVLDGLQSRPALRALVNALLPGDLITLAGIEPDPVPLLVMTIRRAGQHVTDKATLDCVPADIYMAGRWDATGSRWDLKTSTVSAATSTATALTFTQTADESWSTVTPYDLLIGGEKVTVTVMGARTGSGPYTQAATVTRSVNGMIKAQTAGTPVHVATPGRWAI